MDKVTEMKRATGNPAGLREGRRPGWLRPLGAGLLAAAAAGLLAVAGVVAFQMMHSTTVFPGVRVGQVLVGGMTRERALGELRPLFAERSARALSIRAADARRESTLGELGASFDAEAAVEAAYSVGRTGGWLDQVAAQLGSLTNGYSVESPGLRVDRTKLQPFLARLAQEVDRPVRDAELVIGADLSVTVTPSVVGRKMDATAALAAVERAMGEEVVSVNLLVVETQPRRVEKDLEETRARVATILSGPVALEFEGRRWGLTAKELFALMTVEQRVGLPAPVVSVKEEPLKQLVGRIASEVDQSKVNARYDWNGGKLKLLRAGQDGRKVDPAAALAALKEAMAGDRRTMALPVAVDRGAGNVQDPSTLGLKERIDFGRTTITGVAEKQHNIKLAASRLHGVLLAPGDMFSFNQELGPTTLKAGFQTGFGISVTNGQAETVPSVAGGICQVASTLLHAVFWAGYQIEERYPHMYWIPNYGLPPRGVVGLDATVDDPTLDLKFKNNTSDYLLIQAVVNGNALEFSLYGTKPSWKVEVEGPIITNVVKADPKPVRQEEPTWPEGKQLQVETATDGMDVDIIRRVTQGGEVRTLHLRSNYQPARNVLMVGTMKVEPTPGPTVQGTPGPGGTPQAVPAAGGTPQATPTPGAAQATAAPGAAPATATPAAGAPRGTPGPPTPTRPASSPPPAGGPTATSQPRPAGATAVPATATSPPKPPTAQPTPGR